MSTKKTLFLVMISGFILIFCAGGTLQAQDITPAMEQEYLDAKMALAKAKEFQGEKYSAQSMEKAEEFLNVAESMRSLKDGVQFAQASRLSRAYAELAKAVAELKSDQETLVATNEELKNVKTEIEQLKKGQ